LPRLRQINAKISVSSLEIAAARLIKRGIPSLTTGTPAQSLPLESHCVLPQCLISVSSSERRSGFEFACMQDIVKA
jgi:hypothetical protein